MERPLLLYQRTRFCGYAAERLRGKFGKHLQHEGIESLADGRAALEGTQRPAMLIWGSGRSHQLSNALNIPGTRKLVFDNHPDSSCSLSGLDCGNHNDASLREGVAVSVCYAIAGGRSRYSMAGGSQDNGLLHISIDLDFVEGFPALPYMSVGSTGMEAFCRHLERTVYGQERLVRFDIGGYSETSGDFRSVFLRYYSRPLELAVAALSERQPEGMRCPSQECGRSLDRHYALIQSDAELLADKPSAVLHAGA